jgi:hypothetical protein
MRVEAQVCLLQPEKGKQQEARKAEQMNRKQSSATQATNTCQPQVPNKRRCPTPTSNRTLCQGIHHQAAKRLTPTVQTQTHAQSTSAGSWRHCNHNEASQPTTGNNRNKSNRTRQNQRRSQPRERNTRPVCRHQQQPAARRSAQGRVTIPMPQTAGKASTTSTANKTHDNLNI